MATGMQAPPLNALANPQIVNVPAVMSNAMAFKNAKQQNELNEKKLANYDEDRKIAAQERELTNNLKLTHAALEIYKETGDPDLFKGFLKQNGIKDDKIPELKAKKNEISLSAGGVTITGPLTEQMSLYGYFAGNKEGQGPALTPQMLLQAAQENPKLKITYNENWNKQQARQEESDIEGKRAKITTYTGILNTISKTNKMDKESFEGLSPKLQEMAIMFGAGPGKEFDPIILDRYKRVLENEIRFLKRQVPELDAELQDPAGIRGALTK